CNTYYSAHAVSEAETATDKCLAAWTFKVDSDPGDAASPAAAFAGALRLRCIQAASGGLGSKHGRSRQPVSAVQQLHARFTYQFP
ncbi:MAG: hypothetical protein ACK55I_17545, partial [bacterium]